MDDYSDEGPSEDIEPRSRSVPGWSETLVKAGLAAIPYVGGTLATIVADVAARHRERVTDLGNYAITEAGGPERFLQGVRGDERIADMLVSAAFAASETAVKDKRRAMGRVIGQAARDEALIDESQVLLRVLIDLDAPEFHVLGQVAVKDGDQDAVRAVADAASPPVTSALVRNGVVETVGTYDGGLAIVGLTPFGRTLVHFVGASGEDEASGPAS